MLSVQQFTFFENSSDFDVLIKKSFKDIESANEVRYSDFVKNFLPIIKREKTAFILYENDSAIGYQIFLIKNGCSDFSFSYILPEKRNNGYSYLLRDKMINFIIDKVEKFNTTVKKTNKPSIKSLNRIIKKYNCDFKVEEFTSRNGEKYEKYTITKRSN